MRAHPDIERYRLDYMVCLAWADKNEEALRESAHLDLSHSPVYVLEAVAKAARSVGDYDQAARLFQTASLKAPERLAPKLGSALVLMNQGQHQTALDALQRLAIAYPDNIDIALAQAYAYEQANNPSAAIEAYRTALRLQPASEEARRGLLLALANHDPGPDTLAQAEANRKFSPPNNGCSLASPAGRRSPGQKPARFPRHR
jgi:tetratricopeptide (TPR) repeat protein